MPLWTTPKTNWVVTDGIAFSDLNRAEQNTQDLRDAIYRRVQGFGYRSGPGLAYLYIEPGSCFSEDFYPLKFTGGYKALAAHALGFGTGIGGFAPTVTLTTDTWYYIFALGHATSAAVEIMIDDNPAGSNVSLANYPYKRFVNSFKTNNVSAMVEMYSTGDYVFINPNSMFANEADNRSIAVVNSAGINNQYQTVTLQGAFNGFALPARAVRAQINFHSQDTLPFDAIGFFSRMPDDVGTGLAFTIPANLLFAGNFNAEYLRQRYSLTAFLLSDRVFGDFEIMVNSSRQLSIAINSSGAPWGTALLSVRGYMDTREI